MTDLFGIIGLIPGSSVCIFSSNLSAAFRRRPAILTRLIAMACDVVIKAFVTEKGGDMQRSLEPLIWIYGAALLKWVE